MSRRRSASLIVLALCIAAACIPAASTAARGTARCAAGTVAVTINGARSCKPARTVAPIRTSETDATFAARRVLGTAGIRFTMPKLKSGRPLRTAYTPAQTARIVATISAIEATGLAAGVSAVEPRSALARRLRARAARIDAPAGVTISEPVVTVTDRSASISMTAVTDDGAGNTTTFTGGIEARIHDDGRATADVTIGTKQTDPSGVTKGNQITMSLLGKDADNCPRADGRIRYTESYRGSFSSSVSQALGPINLGSVSTSRSADAKSTGTGRMNVDATLLPIPFKVTTTANVVMRGDGIGGTLVGVVAGFYAMTATATGAGTINPRTGAIMGDARFDVRTSGTGSAATRAATARIALDELRTQVGRQYTHFKDVEKRARGGDCTRMTFDPKSGAALAPGATTAVQATMSAHDGSALPNPVMWTVTPLRGKATPTTGTKNTIDTKVTGTAPSSGTTASIRYRAVSRMGISTEVWRGVDSPFPKSYSGTMSYHGTQGSFVNAGAATVTYRLTESRTNPDGSKTGLYSATAHRVTSSELTTVSACTFRYGPVDPGDPQTLKAGDLEIQVSPQGAWTSGALLDVDMGTRDGVTECPPGVPPPPYKPDVKFFFQSRTPTAALRPMQPNGAIQATDSTDVMSLMGYTGTASWNLQPGA